MIDEDSGAIDVSKLRSHFRSMTEVPLEFLILLDVRGDIRFANLAFCRYTKKSLSALLGESFYHFFAAEDCGAIETKLKDIHTEPHEQESRQFIGNGDMERRILRWKFTGIPDSDGRIESILVTGRDVISEQVAEHLISEQDRQLRTVMANLPGMVYRCRNAEPMTLEFVSEGALLLTGYTSGELIESRRKSYSELIHPDDRELVKREMNHAIAGRHAYQFTYRLIRRDGEQIWVREQGCAVYKQSGRVRYLEGIIIDVSKERVLEEQLRQAQKMEAIGQLAGGVAHDFNNLLQVILSYTELLFENEGWSNEIKSSVDHIYKASLRARDLVQQLLAFGRRQILEPVALDLNKLLDKMTKMMPRVLGETITLRFTEQNEVFFVLADPGAIEQVFMNLCLNARDAMPEGGEIVIRLDRQCVSHEEGEGNDIEAGRYVRISVTDNGVGMSSELQSHIFEPFFTTKRVGEGTGLGLATVYGIVRQHGGVIQVESESGKGSTFMVLLREAEPEKEKVDERMEKLPPVQTEGKVLVVEDDNMVRQLLNSTLIRIGVRVDLAVTFSEAVRLLKENGWDYDLVISDLGLPDGRGNELLAQVRLNSSKPRLLLMSGYLDDLDLREDLYYSIRKPFRIKMLTERVVELLGK